MLFLKTPHAARIDTGCIAREPLRPRVAQLSPVSRGRAAGIAEKKASHYKFSSSNSAILKGGSGRRCNSCRGKGYISQAGEAEDKREESHASQVKMYSSKPVGDEE